LFGTIFAAETEQKQSLRLKM